MNNLEINYELLESIPFFGFEENLKSAGSLFDFDRRRVVLGNGAIDRLGRECQRLGLKKILLVRDEGVASLATHILNSLENQGVILVDTYDKVVSNPSVSSVKDCAVAITKSGADGIVAFGGGSTMDTAKAGACVATTNLSIENYWGFDKIPVPAKWPILAVPTTAGTGSEVSRVCVIADKEGKNAVYSDYLQPAVAIVDPQIHMGMPALLTAITGLDALGHALECMASVKCEAIGDAVARESLRIGAKSFVEAVENGKESLDARYGMAKCSLLAGLLLGPINTGAGHALGYGIEKLTFLRGCPVPHGAAVALVLPGVIRHNIPAVSEKYYYAAGVAGMNLKGKTRELGAAEAGAWINDLRCNYTTFSTLEAVGITEEDIPKMVQMALTVRRLLDPNPVPVDQSVAEAIYRSVLN